MHKTFTSKLNQKLQKQVNYSNIYLHLICYLHLFLAQEATFETKLLRDTLTWKRLSFSQIFSQLLNTNSGKIYLCPED